MNNKEMAETALLWYAGHQAEWRGIVRVLDNYFNRDEEKVLSVIKLWPEKYHYGAMLYARNECKCEIWGVDSDDGNSMDYKIKARGSNKWIIIHPAFRRNYLQENDIINKCLESKIDSVAIDLPQMPLFLKESAQQGDAPEPATNAISASQPSIPPAR